MQAILVADYSFTPLEYWRGVSKTAREFIKRCLTVDPKERITAHEALQHPWINPSAADEGDGKGTGEDLLPTVKKNFNARRTLHAAIDTIRAINKLREGGAHGMMNGATSRNPERAPAPPVQRDANSVRRQQDAAGGNGNGAAGANDDRMEVEGEPGERFVHQGGDEMDIDDGSQASTLVQGQGPGVGQSQNIDSRGHGRGQTEEMIKAQERKIRDAQGGLWQRR